mmetsp:Transcript_43540/g.49205  ORF Transcript_43540/g.49205 Transcript_43540/m.49205 type:complete len:86 (+) Transcript_43540:58-315(+)
MRFGVLLLNLQIPLLQSQRLNDGDTGSFYFQFNNSNNTINNLNITENGNGDNNNNNNIETSAPPLVLRKNDMDKDGTTNHNKTSA